MNEPTIKQIHEKKTEVENIILGELDNLAMMNKHIEITGITLTATELDFQNGHKYQMLTDVKIGIEIK